MRRPAATLKSPEWRLAYATREHDAPLAVCQRAGVHPIGGELLQVVEGERDVLAVRLAARPPCQCLVEPARSGAQIPPQRLWQGGKSVHRRHAGEQKMAHLETRAQQYGEFLHVFEPTSERPLPHHVVAAKRHHGDVEARSRRPHQVARCPCRRRTAAGGIS